MSKEEFKKSIKWWESKRWVFNLFIGIAGVLGIINGLNLTEYSLIKSDWIAIVIWSVLANILYSSGLLFEIFDLYYFKEKLRLFKFRNSFFILGTFLYCIVTYFKAWSISAKPFLW